MVPVAPYMPQHASPMDLSRSASGQRQARYEQYYRCTQDDHKKFDWDGRFRGYGVEAAIKPGWYVPMAQRKPSTVYALPRVIVGRLTAMVFGSGNMPTLTVTGDSEAEYFVRALAKEARLGTRLVEGRNRGGPCGSVAFSCGFVNGKPRVEVHNTKTMRVLEWVDRSEMIPRAVVKAYMYDEEEYSEASGGFVTNQYYHVRYWDDTQDVVWEKIPKDLHSSGDWMSKVPVTRSVDVPAGMCPIVWVQNVPDSDNEYSDSDYEGQLDNLDQLNRLRSSANKGTLANTEPTLVVKAPASANTGTLHTGSEHAIYSQGGAEMLTLPGDAMKAAETRASELRQDVLDACHVVVPTAERLAGAAKSAAALRILFAPMTSQCDVLRTQYGDLGIVRILECLLRQAKALGDGVQLDPRLVEVETENPDGSKSIAIEEIDLTPGIREQITLTWSPYFPATWIDIAQAVTAAKTASGGQTLVRPETATSFVAPLMGVEDVKAERLAIEEQAQRDMAAEAKKMQSMLDLEDAKADDPPDDDPDNEGETAEG